jgi:hypothetical protein
MTNQQFRIGRPAADSLNVPALRARARVRGVPSASMDYRTRAAGSGQIDVTCSLEMALVLTDELLALADQAEARRDTDLLSACVLAAKSAFEASADARPGGKTA